MAKMARNVPGLENYCSLIGTAGACSAEGKAETLRIVWTNRKSLGGGKGSVVGGHHGECGARAYNGGLGQSPQRGPGTEPLVRGSGGGESP